MKPRNVGFMILLSTVTILVASEANIYPVNVRKVEASGTTYFLYFHVYDRITLDPIEGARVEILFPNFTIAIYGLINVFGNISFALPAGSYMYGITKIEYLERLSDTFVLGADLTYIVDLCKIRDSPIFITSPADGGDFFWENQTLVGNITDTRIVEVTYNVSSARGSSFGFASVSNQSFSGDITLEEGYNALIVSGLDEFGNVVGIDAITVKLDTWRPVKSFKSNLLDDEWKEGTKEYYDTKNKKTHDLHTKIPSKDTKGRPLKVDIDYTDAEGHKTADLHITYTRKADGSISGMVLEFTDKYGTTVDKKEFKEGDLPVIERDPGTGRVKGYKFKDTEVEIEYDKKTGQRE